MTEIMFPTCGDCQSIHYPPREICPKCLSGNIELSSVPATGKLLTKVDLRHSLEEIFLDNLPWPIGTIQIAEGAFMMAHIYGENLQPDDQVELQKITDPIGKEAFVACAMGTEKITWEKLNQANKIQGNHNGR